MRYLNQIKAFSILMLLSSNIIGELNAKAFYVDATSGSDSNIGSKLAPWKTLTKASEQQYKPGDQLYLSAQSEFKSQLTLSNLKGTVDSPILVTSYSPEQTNHVKAVINASNSANGILIKNSSHIAIENIEIHANSARPLPLLNASQNKSKPMRVGIQIRNTEPQAHAGININNVTIRDIYFHQEGFKRGLSEVKTANGTQSYGWGIRFFNTHMKGSLSDISVKNSSITNVAHTGIKFTGNNRSINNITVTNNQVAQTGGPGIQLSGVSHGHVSENHVINSGNAEDSRKWGRGSGLWTWNSEYILIEHNHFKNAQGPADSAGVHIDFNCNDVIIQYNLSANNAGGFIEVLGNNYNTAYRYNISINDGYRIKGKDHAFQEGKALWLSGYQGTKKPRSGPFNTYIYNNTIYADNSLISKYAISKTSEGALITNNIFYVLNKSQAVLGDQYKPERDGKSLSKNIVFENNLFLSKQSWPSVDVIQDNAPVYGEPEFNNAGGHNITDYIPNNIPLINNQGRKIRLIPEDNKGLYLGLKVATDILGQAVSDQPNIGAIVAPEK